MSTPTDVADTVFSWAEHVLAACTLGRAAWFLAKRAYNACPRMKAAVRIALGVGVDIMNEVEESAKRTWRALFRLIRVGTGEIQLLDAVERMWTVNWEMMLRHLRTGRLARGGRAWDVAGGDVQAGLNIDTALVLEMDELEIQVPRRILAAGGDVVRRGTVVDEMYRRL